jgi:tyrosine-protein phosphatase SIW14
MHCSHGAASVGVMTAIFGVVEQEWMKEDAIQKMVTGGYGFHRGGRINIKNRIIA